MSSMLEVCVDNIQSAINAADGGANRIELCSSLIEGGLTPSLGVFTVLKRSIHIPIFIMLRPRRGMDFVYSKAEIEAMKYDALEFKKAGADGFVFGILKEDGTVDETACEEILRIVRPLLATFHRAFDCTKQPFQALRTLIDLGFQRALTSGQKKSAEEGCEMIKKLVDEAKGRIVVMPGAGVNETNIRKLMLNTGATEVHGSFRIIVKRGGVEKNVSIGSMDCDNDLQITDTGLVRKVVSILKEFSKSG